MARKNLFVEEYARMWPREVFDYLVPNESGQGTKVNLGKGLELVNKPGVSCSTATTFRITSGRQLSFAAGCGPTHVRAVVSKMARKIRRAYANPQP